MQNTVVLLHGWGMNKGVWEIFEKELAEQLRKSVISLNLPGFGGDDCPQPYTLKTAAEILASSIPEHSELIGWSLGGIFALYLAKHFPNKVSKVVLMSSSPCFIQKESWQGITTHVLDNFKQQLTVNTAKTIDRFLAIQAMGSEHAKAEIKLLKKHIARTVLPEQLALEAGLHILQHTDLRHELAALKQPIYGIFGKLDSLVPHKIADKIMQIQPCFSYKVIEKASHAPFISHKQDTLTYIKSIL